MLKIAVFVSGRGSNLKAILNAVSNKEISVNIEAIVSDKIDCPAFEIANDYSIPVYSVKNEKSDGFHSYPELISIFENIDIQLIVLAGFLKKIPDELIDKYPNKIINIHPALLPSFGGKGMYGLNVHKAVFEKSAQVSGPTIHFVDKIYDNGKIIAQQAVDISDVEKPEEIAAKVLEVEHKLLPFVVGKFADNKVKIKNNRVVIEK